MHDNVRIIGRLDIKAPNLIKGVRLEGLRVMGDPYTFAKNYYEQGVDELLYMDIVASLYNRNSLSDVMAKVAKDVFVPMTVGGGLRNFEDAKAAFDSGADKIAINTAAVRDPNIIRELSRKYGDQAIVLSVEAKANQQGWEVYTDNGRERTGLQVRDWVQKVVPLGVGEILLTSVDREGTRKGFDLSLVDSVVSRVKVPVIVSGGFGELADFKKAVDHGASAVAVADAFHYDRVKIGELRRYALDQGIPVRPWQSVPPT